MPRKQKSSLAVPWLQSGLTHILLATEARRDELLGVNTNPPPKAIHPHGPNANDTEQEHNDNAIKTGVGKKPIPSVASAEKYLKETADRKKTHDNSQNSKPKPVILQMQDWPPEWLAIRNRRPFPPRPKVTWTYEGLDADLSGKGEQVRQDLVVRILKDLRHPAGTHYFWPYSLTGRSDEVNNDMDAASLFWSGEAVLRPRALLLFGLEARLALDLPDSLFFFTTQHIQGRRLILLPPVSQLTANPEDYTRALAVAAKALAFCE